MGASEWYRGKPPNALRAKVVEKEEEEEEEEEDKSPRYPLDRRLSGPQNRSGGGGSEKNSTVAPPRKWTAVVQFTYLVSQLIS